MKRRIALTALCLALLATTMRAQDMMRDLDLTSPAMVSAEIADKDCAASLMASEAAARRQKMGSWADPSAIKNTESPDDILAEIGRFAVVEGKVLSVRQAGATTYLNFGRSWTRGFAATISKRTLPAFESAGIDPRTIR